MRAGSPLIHVKQIRDRQRSHWTMKGTRVEVKVLWTKYTTVDLRTCRVVATTAFDGAVVSRYELPDEVEAIVIDETGAGGPLKTTRRRLPVSGRAAGTGHLVRQGAALAFLGPETPPRSPEYLEVFELAGGSRIRRYPLPREGAIAWSAVQASLLAFATLDREKSVGPCGYELTVIDIDRDVSRLAVLPACFSSLSWIGPSPFLRVDRHKEIAVTERWVFDPQRAVTIPATTTGVGWQSLDDMVVFIDGPEGGRRAMALTPAGPRTQPLSHQRRVRFVSVEPTSRSVFIGSEHEDLFVYRADAQRLERCVEF